MPKLPRRLFTAKTLPGLENAEDEKERKDKLRSKDRHPVCRQAGNFPLTKKIYDLRLTND